MFWQIMRFFLMMTLVMKVAVEKKIQRKFVWSSANALLNNFCFNENNNIKNNKLSKKENFKHSTKF